MSLYSEQQINSPSDTVFKYQTKRPITLINSFPCGIVFDEAKVNPDQASLLVLVVKELRKRGFSPSKWMGSFTADVKAEHPSRLGINEPLFNILLLDGFSPNLLYRYGLLKGEGKPVILLVSKNASIPVKSLYNSIEDSGLAANLFNNHFLEPIIDLPFLLNGLAPDQLGIVDLKAISNEPSQPNLTLKEILAKTGGFFIDALKKRLTQQFPGECLNEINPLLEIFCEFYRASSTGSRFSKMNQLRTVYASLQQLAEHYRFTLPYDFAKLLISSIVFLGIQNAWEEPAEKESYLRLALAISRDLHNTTEDPYKRAYLAKEIGAIGTELFLRDGSVESLQTAEQALAEALKLYQVDNYPVEFGMVRNNQGVVQLGKAIYFGRGEELQLASTAFKDAQAVFKNNFLTQYQYQISQFNLGLTLARQGELNSDPKLLHQALNEYDTAVNIAGAETQFLAQIHQNRGDLYQELAVADRKFDFYQNTIQSFQKALELGVSNFGSEETKVAWGSIGEAALKMAERQEPATNLKLAINAYMQFFKVHQDTCSPEWGKAGKNLADAYFSLANYETNIVHYNSAVSIYLESLRVLTPDSFPEDFIAIQKNLAIIYRSLAQAGNDAENYCKAIDAWREVLRLTSSEDLLQQAECNLELAKLYSDLSLIEQSEQHNQTASIYYQTVVELTTSKLEDQNCLKLYIEAQFGLGKTYKNLAVTTDPKAYYQRALTAFEELLKLSRPEFLSDYLGEVEYQIGNISYNLALLEPESAPYCKKAEEAYNKALSSYTLETDPERFSKIQSELGEVYGILGESENQKYYYNLGVTAYHSALESKLQPIETAAILKKRGDLLLKLASIEETALNCQTALNDYDSALIHYVPGKFPHEYELIQKSRGDAFQKLAEVENAVDNSKRAIAAYQEALQFVSIAQNPLEYGAVQKELGKTYLYLFKLGQDLADCHKAAQAFQLALAAYPKDQHPGEYATIQNLLGNTYLILAEREPAAENYNNAVKSFEEVVELQSAGTLSQDFMTAQINLGLAYTNLAAVRGDAADYQRAVNAYEKALDDEGLKDSSYEYAQVFLKMGDAYLRLAELNQDREACQRGIIAYDEALKVFTIDDYPMLFATTQKNIAGAYGLMGRLEKTPVSYSNALLAFNKALQVYTPAMPLLYAEIQREMGDFYFNWAKLENPVDNYQSSLACYRESLTVWTLKTNPVQYGDVQTRLAQTYAKLSELENPTVYCRKAIHGYEMVLQSGDLGAAPSKVFQIQEGLGDMFLKLAEIEKNMDHCRNAILAFEKAAAVIDSANPLPNLILKEKLGDCYGLAAELGEPLFNFKKAISFYQEIIAHRDSIPSPPGSATILIKLGRITEQVAFLEENPILYREALSYYLESLQLIKEEPERSATIYQKIANIYLKLAETDETLTNTLKSIQMYHIAVQLYSGNDLPKELALAQDALGTAYQRLAELDNKTKNTQKAIEMFSSAVKVLTESNFPLEFALIQHKMGNAYYGLAAAPDQTECFRNALICYEAALPYLNPVDYHREYLITLQNLGVIYLHLMDSNANSKDYLSKSITIFQDLLKLIKKEQSPLEYASYQITLGNGFVRLAAFEDPVENYERGIAAYNAAFEIYQQLKRPAEMAQIQKNLADAYYELAFIVKTEDFAQKSILYYRAALPYFIKTAPREGAVIHQKLGRVLALLSESTGETSWLQEGIAALNEAIEIFQGLPQEETEYLGSDFSGATLHQLGNLLVKLASIKQEDKEEILKKAISHYQTVIKMVRSEKSSPEPIVWQNLGEAYLDLAECELPIPTVSEHSRAALTAFEEAGSQGATAKLKYLTGRCYYRLAQFEELLPYGEKAIAAFKEALEFDDLQQHTPFWAEIQYWLGNAYSLYGTAADGESNYQHAIECYQAALKVRTVEYLPSDYGITQRELGKALQFLAQYQEPLINYGLAIESFTEAVKTLTPENYPLEYVECQRYLGDVELKLAEFENNLPHTLNAIKAYHNALSVLEHQPAHPEHSQCYYGLGTAYLKLAASEDTAENCLKAIDSFQKAQAQEIDDLQQLATLYEYSGSAYRLLWETNNQVEYREEALNSLRSALQQYRQVGQMINYALIQQQIGSIYQKMATIDLDSDHWKTAIEAFREALRVTQSDSYPEHYASFQANLGDAFMGLGELENPVINYNRAIQAYLETLTVWSPERYPDKYVMVKENMGLIYERLADLENKASYLRLSLDNYLEALKVQSISDAPAQYGRLQRNCGIILNTLTEIGETDTGYLDAINAFEEALRVYSKENYPMDYAIVRYHLGNSYRLAAESGEVAQNCQKAINHYESAIEFFSDGDDTKKDEDYAMLQWNLGNAYLMLSNLKEPEACSRKAAIAFENAANFYYLRNHQKEHAMVQRKLGEAYQILAKITRQPNEYENAATAYRKALSFYTAQSYPNQYSIIQKSLGELYHQLAGISAPAENLQKAISSYMAALKILRIKDLADAGWVQQQLGIAYSTLADHENKGENCKLALEALEDAIKLSSPLLPPSQMFLAWYERGMVFQKLAAIEEGMTNYHQSILCFQTALDNASQDSMVLLEMARIQKAMGDSFFGIAGIEPKVENLRKAQEVYLQALEVFSGNGAWAEYGAIQKNLGNIFTKLAYFGNKRDNCKSAIISCQEALKYYSPEEHLSDYIAIMSDLGDSYRLLAETDGESSHFQNAIETFERVLMINPGESERVKILIELGSVYRTLAKSEEFVDNSKKALQYFEKALRIASSKRMEIEQLNILFNIGCLYFELAGAESSAQVQVQNYKKSLQMFNEINKTTSTDYHPQQYAASQNELGRTYCRLADLEKNNNYLNLALNCFNEALKVRVTEVYPLEYAETQMYLGSVYYRLAGVENTGLNYEMALEAYRKASDIYFQKNILGDYARARYEMGKIYGLLAGFELNPQRLHDAINYIMEVFKTGPVKWQPLEIGDARLQLGLTYLKLGQFQSSTEHYQSAISNCSEAAAIYFKLNLMDRYQIAKHSLGEAHHRLAQTTGRIEDYKNAIHVYEDAIKYIPKETAPFPYALFHKELGELYESLSSLGYETDFYEKAANSYLEGLSVLTKHDQYFDLLQQRLGEVYLKLALSKDPYIYAGKALEALQRALQNDAGKHSPERIASIWSSTGQSYAFLAKLAKNSVNWKKAITAYEKALKNLPDNTHDMKRSNLQIKLGEALLGLAEYEETIDNTKSAIYAFQEAFRGLNPPDLLKYGEALNQFGAAYYVLAVAETFRDGNQLHSLAYQEIKSVTDGGAIPKWYAFAREILDDQSMSMAKMEEKSWNCRQAMELLHQSLQVYSREQQSKIYASIQQNIGNVYLAYYEVDHNLSILENAIEAYQEAAQIWDSQDDPLVYANCMNCLGNAYQIMARSIAKAENAAKAIAAYETALSICTFERFPLNYGILQNNIKNTCYLWAEEENNVDIYKRVFEACEEALKVFTKRRFPKMYRLLKYEIDNLVNLLIN